MGLPQKTSIINKYNLDLSNLQGYTFGLDEEWLDFIIMNRNYVPHKITYTQYDYLKGATADDKLFSTIEQYENGFISQSTAIKILNCMDIGSQICLKNNKCLEHLYYIESITPSLEEKNNIQLQIKNERQLANSITEKSYAKQIIILCMANSIQLAYIAQIILNNKTLLIMKINAKINDTLARLDYSLLHTDKHSPAFSGGGLFILQS